MVFCCCWLFCWHAACIPAGYTLYLIPRPGCCTPRKKAATLPVYMCRAVMAYIPHAGIARVTAPANVRAQKKATVPAACLAGIVQIYMPVRFRWLLLPAESYYSTTLSPSFHLFFQGTGSGKHKTLLRMMFY